MSCQADNLQENMEAKNILVTGGCGYIGSHMVKKLLGVGCSITVLDDLSAGFRDSLLGGQLIEGDFGDPVLLESLFESIKFDGVLHFASLIKVGESVSEPGRYYRNNVVKTLVLLEEMMRHGVNCMVYSSSAAVYGDPQYLPVDELHPCNPVNPYGRTKAMVEAMLGDFGRTCGMHSVALRYFNAAGADPESRIGERHHPETHLIPLAIRAALGSGPSIKVFGQDYATPDGTCIRDFVHVDDLCDAHLEALEYLWNGGGTSVFNLGSGRGFSVREVLKVVEEVTGRRVPVELAPRREGDPARLVADATRARSILGWSPQHADLYQIVLHAWQWEQHCAVKGSGK